MFSRVVKYGGSCIIGLLLTSACGSGTELGRSRAGPGAADASDGGDRSGRGVPEGGATDALSRSTPDTGAPDDAHRPPRTSLDSSTQPDATACVTSTRGVHVPIAPGPTTSAGNLFPHALVADESGAYFTESVTGSGPQDVLFVSPVTGSPALHYPKHIENFTVIGSKVWYFDEGGALTQYDVVSETTTQSTVGTGDPLGRITDFASSLYWIRLEGSLYQVVRAAVTSDGAVGATELLNESTEVTSDLVVSSAGIAWREGRDIVFEPHGGSPAFRRTLDAPRSNSLLAMNATKLFAAIGEYTVASDGGCVFGLDSATCAVRQSTFLGAKLVSWDLASGRAETLYDSTTAFLVLIAATDGAVYFAYEAPGLYCPQLWRRSNGSSTNELVASGRDAPIQFLAANATRAYWLSWFGLESDQ